MDYSTLSNQHLYNLFLELRKDILDGEYNEELLTAYYSLLEYVVATKGQDVADTWTKDADLASKHEQASPDYRPPADNGNSFPWWLVGAAAVLFMWRK